MRIYPVRISVLSSFLFLIFSFSIFANSTPKNYLIITKSEKVSSKIIDDLKKIDGKINFNLEKIGIISVTSSNSDFEAKAKKITGIHDVVQDAKLNFIPGEKNFEFTEDYENPPYSGDDDIRFDLQWGHDAVDAIEAWNAGYRGNGVRVAVLDSGFDLDHPDLAPNIDFASSASFVTGEGLGYALPDVFSHGSHTAGTVAAADNGFGTIGVAPEAELVLVKVLTDAGSGAFSWIIGGIYHAAMEDADIITMSIGANIPRHGYIDDNGTPDDPTDDYRVNAAQLQSIFLGLSRAANFAYQNGSLLIASAGNEAIDGDHNADLIHLPSGIQNILSISATAPIGWATDPLNAFLSYPASYTNYGQSTIDLAAPGGDTQYPGNESCLIGGLLRPCWVFDLVFSTGNNGWYWSAGTSMAAPHAAGVAAIVKGANPNLSPAQLENILKRSAVDLGKPGNDDYYGAGLVNAYNALKVMRLAKENPEGNVVSAIPNEYSLDQNYPNPFNPSTMINFQIPENAEVTLNVYNVQGELIRTLVSEFKDAGYYSVSWDGRDNFSKPVSSGVYIYKLSAGTFNQAAKMMLVK